MNRPNYPLKADVAFREHAAIVANFAIVKGQFEYVQCAAEYQLCFAGEDTKTDYHDFGNFEEYVSRHNADLENLSKSIDTHLNDYWRNSLSATTTATTDLITLFEKHFGPDNKQKNRRSIPGVLSVAYLSKLNDRIRLTKTNLDSNNYSFESPKDSVQWTRLAACCIGPLNDAYAVHKHIENAIEEKLKARRVRYTENIKIILSLGGIAVRLGAVLFPAAGVLPISGIP